MDARRRRQRRRRARRRRRGGAVASPLVVDAYPIGIDPPKFERALASAAVRGRVAQLRSQFAGQRVLLGIDRVDYIKGVREPPPPRAPACHHCTSSRTHLPHPSSLLQIPHKILAFEQLLEQHPEYIGKVVLLQIAVPTRTEVPEYQRARATAHRLVATVNGRFGSPSYVPIHYLDQSVDFDEMVALYARDASRTGRPTLTRAAATR